MYCGFLTVCSHFLMWHCFFARNVEQRPLWDRVEKLQPRPGSGSSSGSSNSSSQASPGDRFRPRCESPATVLGYVSNLILHYIDVNEKTMIHLYFLQHYKIEVNILDMSILLSWSREGGASFKQSIISLPFYRINENFWEKCFNYNCSQ